MRQFLQERDWSQLTSKFVSAQPYDHVIIDNFFNPVIAEQMAADFPDWDDSAWYARWNNPIEDKKGCNHWDCFPPTTYSAFQYLCSGEFVDILSAITGSSGVTADVGLHGGGWHAHATGGKLNVHLDYSIHPKLKLQRHFNLIVYLTPNWDANWGGGLELWESNADGSPKSLHTVVENRFNRALIFDTTQNSWHGLPNAITCPPGIMRQSLAMYYMTEPAPTASTRGKALYMPHRDQANDPKIIELIHKRSQVETAASVYRS